VIGGHSEVAIVGAITPSLAAALNLPLGAGVFISHRMWQSAFGGNANIRGKRIRLNNDAERLRGRELALHIAFGAQCWQISLKVLMNVARLVFAGNLVGMLVSLVLSRVMVGEAVTVSSRSLTVWLIAPIVSTLAVLIASVLPAHRACRIDPLTIMRDDC
jgi:hypothetical protein